MLIHHTRAFLSAFHFFKQIQAKTVPKIPYAGNVQAIETENVKKNQEV
jgi:hypothetical protein